MTMTGSAMAADDAARCGPRTGPHPARR